MSLLFPRARAVQWNVFEGEKVGRLKYIFRASKAQDEMKKKTSAEEKTNSKLERKLFLETKLDPHFQFFSRLSSRNTLGFLAERWLFANCEYMTISSAAKDMLQKLSRCNRNIIMIIYLVTRVFISLSHLHAMKIRKP